MAKKKTPLDALKSLNDIVLSFSGKSIKDLVEEGWEKYRQTRIGDAAAPMERAARAMDPFTVLGLPHDATPEEVKERYRQLSLIFHPDRKGGDEAAMKLLNNAYEAICRKQKGGE